MTISVFADFSLEDARRLMKHLMTLGNFDEFRDSSDQDGLSDEVAFELRDFIRDCIVVTPANPPTVGRRPRAPGKPVPLKAKRARP